MKIQNKWHHLTNEWSIFNNIELIKLIETEFYLFTTVIINYFERMWRGESKDKINGKFHLFPWNMKIKKLKNNTYTFETTLWATTLLLMTFLQNALYKTLLLFLIPLKRRLKFLKKIEKKWTKWGRSINIISMMTQ